MTSVRQGIGYFFLKKLPVPAKSEPGTGNFFQSEKAASPLVDAREMKGELCFDILASF